MPRPFPKARHSIATWATLLLVAGVFSCSKPSGTAANSTPSAAPDTMPAAQITDGNALAFLMTANSAEIEDARLASTRSHAGAVKAFANMMSVQHQQVKGQIAATADSAQITPQDDAVSRALATASDSARESIRGLSGPAFDRAYMDHAIEAHQSLLDALDQRLIPGAGAAQVKQLLTSIRPAVASHLVEAKRVRATLGD